MHDAESLFDDASLVERITASLAAVGNDENELAALVALAGLPHLAPGRFRGMLEGRSPTDVWRRIVAGRPPLSGRARDAAHGWTPWAAQIEPLSALAQHRAAGVQISWIGSPTYPNALLDDPDPPVVLFEAGARPVRDVPGVAVVGTRRCTRYGREVAHELGARLGSAGVPVVSGLAHGIDAAAHAGAVRSAGPAVAVVAGGVDVIYPRGNRELWHDVLAGGCVASEYPLGATPLTWRFPARNRLIAALSAMVIVVESPEKGGSMYTVDEALRRDRVVAAVPGSIRSIASAGSNRLIADGAVPICSIDELIELIPAKCGAQPAVASPGQVDHIASTPAVRDSWLLPFVSFDPVLLDAVVAESRRSVSDVAFEVERLIAGGILHRSGASIERVR